MDASNGTNGANGTLSSSKLLWRHPDPHATPMYEYLQAVNQTYNLRLSMYQDLHKWSIENIDAFWQSVWKFAGVRAEGNASPVRHTKTQ
jgi:acetoacetyl-CoA synthetase